MTFTVKTADETWTVDTGIMCAMFSPGDGNWKAVRSWSEAHPGEHFAVELATGEMRFTGAVVEVLGEVPT